MILPYQNVNTLVFVNAVQENLQFADSFVGGTHTALFNVFVLDFSQFFPAFGCCHLAIITCSSCKEEHIHQLLQRCEHGLLYLILVSGQGLEERGNKKSFLDLPALAHLGVDLRLEETGLPQPPSAQPSTSLTLTSPACSFYFWNRTMGASSKLLRTHSYHNHHKFIFPLVSFILFVPRATCSENIYMRLKLKESQCHSLELGVTQELKDAANENLVSVTLCS